VGLMVWCGGLHARCALRRRGVMFELMWSPKKGTKGNRHQGKVTYVTVASRDWAYDWCSDANCLS
jgi:hypothetical protein